MTAITFLKFLKKKKKIFLMSLLVWAEITYLINNIDIILIVGIRHTRKGTEVREINHRQFSAIIEMSRVCYRATFISHG